MTFLLRSVAFLLQDPVGPAGNAAANPPPSWMPLLVTFGPIAVLFYFLLVRPNQKRERDRQGMINAIKKNDHVVTIGGIKGVVSSLEGDEIELRVDDRTGTRIVFTKSAIARVITGGKSSEAAKES